MDLRDELFYSLLFIRYRPHNFSYALDKNDWLIKELIDTQKETLAPLCTGLQALTDRQNKLEQAILSIKENLAATHPPKKIKHHPYYD